MGNTPMGHLDGHLDGQLGQLLSNWLLLMYAFDFEIHTRSQNKCVLATQPVAIAVRMCVGGGV